MATVPIYQLILEGGSVFDPFPQLGRFAAYIKHLTEGSKERKVQKQIERENREKEESLRVEEQRKRWEEDRVTKARNGQNMMFQYGQKDPVYLPISDSSSEEGDMAREQAPLLTSREGSLMAKAAGKQPLLKINAQNTSQLKTLMDSFGKYLTVIFFLVAIVLLIGGSVGWYHLLTHEGLVEKNQDDVHRKLETNFSAENGFMEFKLAQNLKRKMEGKEEASEEDLIEEYVAYMQKAGYERGDARLKVHKKIEQLQSMMNRTNRRTVQQRAKYRGQSDLWKGMNIHESEEILTNMNRYSAR